MIIRWLGAFAKTGTLAESIQYECNREVTDEVAAEYVNKGISQIAHAKVGLLIANKALIKKYNGDCWSVLEDGKLVKTRNPKHAGSTHKEAWANPVYTAVVIKDRISKQAMMEVKHLASINNLPVLTLKGGQLK